MESDDALEVTTSSEDEDSEESVDGESFPATIIQDAGSYNSSCGYCHSGADTSCSHGMFAKSMTVHDYQDLIDQGWRRSGTFLYKPDMKATCCPQYTIRLDVRDFVTNKPQRQLLRKWDKYLAGGIDLQASVQGHQQRASVDGHEQGSSANTSTAAGADSMQIDSQQAAKGGPEACGSLASTSQAPKLSPSKTQQQHHTEQARADQQSQRQQQPKQQHAGSSAPQQQAVSEQEQQVIRQLQQLLQAAVASCASSGALPKVEYPDVQVVKCSTKQQRQLGSAVHYTSAAPLMLAATARKAAAAPAGGAAAQQRLNPDAVCEMLAQAFNAPAGGSSAASAAVAPTYVAKANRGHINFASADEVMHPSSCASHQQARTPQPAQQASLPGPHHAPSSQQQQQQQQPHSGSQQHQQQPVVSPSQQHRRSSRSPRRKSPKRAAGDSAGGNAGTTEGAPNSSPDAGCSAGAFGSGSQAPSGQPRARRFEVRMVRSEFNWKEYELYKKYQTQQHGDEEDELSPEKYTRFLVESPLTHVSREEDASAPECGYGSFHQQYWLDGRLIAVGVVDVLPRCLSSVYFFWDVDFAPLAPGKYSALQEIEWVKQAMASCPSLVYYYMGFYIHSCPKMRYKAEYAPSELVCPASKEWVRINPEVLQALEASKYVELSALPGAIKKPSLAPVNLLPAAAPAGAGGAQQQQAAIAAAADEVQLLLRSAVIPWKVVKQLGIIPARFVSSLQQSLERWVALVGGCSSRILYAA